MNRKIVRLNGVPYNIDNIVSPGKIDKQGEYYFFSVSFCNGDVVTAHNRCKEYLEDQYRSLLECFE